MGNNLNDGVHQHIDGPIRQFLKEELTASGLERVEEMVGRFSAEGQIAVSTLLVYAAAEGKLEDALRELEPEWEGHFGLQHPEIRGNPNFSDNAAHLGLIYGRLGVQPPWDRR